MTEPVDPDTNDAFAVAVAGLVAPHLDGWASDQNRNHDVLGWLRDGIAENAKMRRQLVDLAEELAYAEQDAERLRADRDQWRGMLAAMQARLAEAIALANTQARRTEVAELDALLVRLDEVVALLDGEEPDGDAG